MTGQIKTRVSALRGISLMNGLQYMVRELDRPEARTKGGVIMPPVASQDEWAKYGLIVAVGDGDIKPDGEFYQCKYQVGATVLIDRYTSVCVHDGEYLRIVPERFIVCLIDAETIAGIAAEA